MALATTTSRTLSKQPPIVGGMRPTVPPVVRETGETSVVSGAADGASEGGHITTVSFVITLVVALFFDLVSLFGSLLSVAFAASRTTASLSAGIILMLGVVNIFVALSFFTYYAMKGLGYEAGSWALGGAIAEFIPGLQGLIFQNSIMVYIMWRHHRATLLEEAVSVVGVVTTVGTGGVGAVGAKAVGTAGKKAAGAAEKAAVSRAARPPIVRGMRPDVPPVVAGPSRTRAYAKRLRDYAGQNLSSEELVRKTREHIKEGVQQRGIDAVLNIPSQEQTEAEDGTLYTEEETI